MAVQHDPLIKSYRMHYANTINHNILIANRASADDEPGAATTMTDGGPNHIGTTTTNNSNGSTSTMIQMNGIANGTNNATSSSSTAAAAAASVAASAGMISPSLMVRYLQDELKASELKHCDTCLCASGSRDLQVLADTARSYSVGTQTQLHGDANNALCLRCNSNLNSPSRTNSPYIMKLVKSSDSVISETKSSYSGSLAALDMTGYMGGTAAGGGCDKLMYGGIGMGTLAPMQTHPRKDDLTVNPILGHHRLCDRKATATKQRESALAAAAAVELQIEQEMRALAGRPATQVASGQGLGKGTTTTITTAEAPTPQQQQQQPMDTASGSTNSLWSKTSSTNNNSNVNSGSAGNSASNAEGAKMFETFNRNLIKSIKVSAIK